MEYQSDLDVGRQAKAWLQMMLRGIRVGIKDPTSYGEIIEMLREELAAEDAEIAAKELEAKAALLSIPDTPAMTYRIRFHIEGSHVRCALFYGAMMTGSLCGHFRVRKGEEFRELNRAFAGADFFGDVAAVDTIHEASSP